MKWRFFLVLGAFAFLFGSLGMNLYELQIEQGEYYVDRVEAMQEERAERLLRRGQIFFTDRSGTDIPVALNRDDQFIFASPGEMEDPEAVAERIAGPLGLDAEEVKADFGKNPESLYVPLVEKASAEMVSFVTEESPEGIHIDSKQYRFYPFGELGSQLLGFYGINDSFPNPVGLYGAEKQFNTRLEKGEDVRLTIDRNIQARAEELIEDLVRDHEAAGGTVIVQDPRTGAILAMASVPGFDPNDYGSYPIKNFLNPAVNFVYEPGSVFKPLTLSAGIDAGKLSAETKFHDPGFVTLNGRTIRNWGNHVYGDVTMQEVIENSINTGAVRAEEIVGHDTFYEYMKQYGFTEKTGIDLPDQVGGNLRNLTSPDVREVDYATAAFGQGVAVTPLHVVNAFSAVANGGLLMRPYVDADRGAYIVRRVIEEDTAAEIARILESTVYKANVTRIPEYGIAGKTGTAFVPDFVNGGYSEEMIHTFTGFAPASNPQFVGLIKLERPQVGDLAGLTVVPAFKELARFLLNYYSIPPDKIAGS